MEQLTLAANAKLNLSLDIVGRREDGYHLMRMVMQSVTLADTLTLMKTEEGIALSCDDPALSHGPDNLAWKAAAAFFAETKLPGGISVKLQKRIPSGAGLGGGSADAAAVLLGLSRLYGVKLPFSRMMELGAFIGADVPFCLHGGTALVEGIGERVSPLSPLPGCGIVIVKPERSVNTAAAFAAFDRQPPVRRPDTEGLLHALNRGDLQGLSRLLCNVFEATADFPGLSALKERLLRSGALGALMTGSGSAVFGLFKTLAEAEACRDLFCREGMNAFSCRPSARGVVFYEKGGENEMQPDVRDGRV